MNSSTLKSYLTGLILGDGFIGRGNSKRPFYIKSIYKDFVQKIKRDLDESTNFETKIQEFDERTGIDGVHHKPYWELSIKSHPYFSKIYHEFYNDFSKRIISKKSLERLDWNGYANWYMSDGYIVKVGKESGIIVDRRVELCTDRYSKNSVEFLKQFLEYNFNYKIKIVKRGNIQRIRISLLDAQNFLYNISPFVISSFYYKLDMAYTYKPKWMNDDYYNLMKNIQQHQTPI